MDVPEESPKIANHGSELLGIPDFLRNVGQKVARYSEWMKKRASALADSLRYLRDHFTEIMECMTALFVLVIEKIILLAILLPIGLLYCLRKAYGWLAEEELDEIITALFEKSTVKKAGD